MAIAAATIMRERRTHKKASRKKTLSFWETLNLKSKRAVGGWGFLVGFVG